MNCSEKQYGGMGGKGKGRVREEEEGSVSLSTSGSSNFLKFLKCFKEEKNDQRCFYWDSKVRALFI